MNPSLKRPRYVDRATGRPVRAWRMSEALREIPRPSAEMLRDFAAMQVRSPERSIFELELCRRLLYELADARASLEAVASRPKATFGKPII